jgi:lipopolysaccharide export system permease protein
MMNLKQLKDNEMMTRRQVDSGIAINFRLISAYIKYFTLPAKPFNVKKYLPASVDTLAGTKINEQLSALSNAAGEARSIQDLIKNRADRDSELIKNIRRAVLEYQKKFTLSAACIALFLIGAPLGAIIRKGGLGLPVVVSVIFFLIYYIISTIGEKSAKDGDLSPVIGSWIAIVIITPIGIFLSYKAATDSVIFDTDLYKRFFKKLFKKKTQVSS